MTTITKDFIKRIINANDSHKNKRRKVLLIKEKILRLISKQENAIDLLKLVQQQELKKKTKELEALKKWVEPSKIIGQDEDFNEYGYFVWLWENNIYLLELDEKLRMQIHDKDDGGVV
jgi:hypothetical protein